MNELCKVMDRVLAGRDAVSSTVDGANAELHGPSSAKGSGGYYFTSIEVGARLKLDESCETFVPGGFSIVPIGLEEVKEKLGIFERNGVRDVVVK